MTAWPRRAERRSLLRLLESLATRSVSAFLPPTKIIWGNAVADKLAAIRYEVALANRILANEGIVDAFGHCTARHPTNPSRYLMSVSRAPELVEPSDIVEFDLDSQPVKKDKRPFYSERVIHGEIYKARPDVMSVCHHHAPSFMPLVITGIDYVPVFHLGAIGGAKPPFWDQRKE